MVLVVPATHSTGQQRPKVGVKAWVRQRVEVQRACYNNWRERVCVLHTATWGVKGSRIQRPGWGSQEDTQRLSGPRALACDFVVDAKGGWLVAVRLTFRSLSASHSLPI